MFGLPSFWLQPYCVVCDLPTYYGPGTLHTLGINGRWTSLPSMGIVVHGLPYVSWVLFAYILWDIVVQLFPVYHGYYSPEACLHTTMGLILGITTSLVSWVLFAFIP